MEEVDSAPGCTSPWEWSSTRCSGQGRPLLRRLLRHHSLPYRQPGAAPVHDYNPSIPAQLRAVVELATASGWSGTMPWPSGCTDDLQRYARGEPVTAITAPGVQPRQPSIPAGQAYPGAGRSGAGVGRPPSPAGMTMAARPGSRNGSTLPRRPRPGRGAGAGAGPGCSRPGPAGHHGRRRADVPAREGLGRTSWRRPRFNGTSMGSRTTAPSTRTQLTIYDESSRFPHGSPGWKEVRRRGGGRVLRH